MAEWTSNANEALTLSLVRAPEDEEVLVDDENYDEFHPTFTYPIFGEEEKIYGYRDLVIDLRFASGSLVQYLSVNSKAKLKSSSTVDDVEGTLYKFIPPDYYKKEDEFLQRVAKDATEFKPLGERIASYKQRLSSAKGKDKADDEADEDEVEEAIEEEDGDVVEFEVYHATWSTPGFREYHRRMQVFILLYIEAGSYIQEDEEGWEFVVLYEKRRRHDEAQTPTYHFVGYSSLFPFYCFPDMVRMRLSQFVILPPYQRLGHGSALYRAIYTYVLSEPRIAELTVEDPAEAFEDLRDRNDLRMLLAHERFMSEGLEGLSATPTVASVVQETTSATSTTASARTTVSSTTTSTTTTTTVTKGKGKAKGKLGPPADKGWVEKWRRELKIAGRQFHRLIEMLILKHLDPSDDRAMRAFRLQVKERLYKFNYEILVQLDKQERLEKLEETFQSVKEDYGRILAMIS